MLFRRRPAQPKVPLNFAPRRIEGPAQPAPSASRGDAARDSLSGTTARTPRTSTRTTPSATPTRTYTAKRLNPFARIAGMVTGVWSVVTFLFLVIGYVVHQMLRRVLSWRVFPRSLQTGLDAVYGGYSRVLDGNRKGGADRSYFISLALRNMQVKKTRTVVTMGGMAIGIAFIVFLVSVGYGLQNLVISRVARLEELKQADVLPGLTPDLALTDKTLADFSAIPNVDQVLPVIAVVGRMSYQNSVSDMAVYGVTADYLRNSAIQPSRGRVFDSNEVTTSVVSSASIQREVVSHEPAAPVSTLGDSIGGVEFTINAGAWLRVRSEPSPTGTMLGYTRAVQDNQVGTEIWGEAYSGGVGGAGTAGTGAAAANPDATDSAQLNTQLGKWISTTVLLWQETGCTIETDPRCQDGYVPLLDESGTQMSSDGYLAEISMRVTPLSREEQVLGVSIVSPAYAQSAGSLPLVEIETESAAEVPSSVRVIDLPASTERVAVVNRSVLQVLGITEDEAVDKEITMTFVIVGELQSEQTEKVESAPLAYRIVGVTPDEGTPMVYVPFVDLRALGVDRYSQAKVVVDDVDHLQRVHSTIEASGYGTVSVTDTVAQIDNLFASFRLVLAVLGLVALSVAALGMFNTLTVSLLERTREVGLMKAMGMKSREVRELFLTESMIMGFFGGIIGLVMGVLLGKLLSIILSVFSLVRGVGFVDISHVPPSFVLIVIAISVIVGILTGYFPARRATKISALNALRYE